MDFNNITIVIQGPLHKNSINTLDYYKKIGNVVISHWDTDDTNLLKDIDGIDIVSNGLPNKPQVFNNQNVFYQAVSTFMGLSHVNTEYVIKLRSDDSVGNLVPMIRAILQNPGKFICSNQHFRPDRLAKFHASDKMIGGLTCDLLDTFYMVIDRCEHHSQLLLAGIYEFSDLFPTILYKDLWGRWSAGAPVVTEQGEQPLLGTVRRLNNNHAGVYAETLIATSFLMIKNVFPDRKKSIEIMKKWFLIVKVEDMQPYLNKWGTNDVGHNWEEINNINEI